MIRSYFNFVLVEVRTEATKLRKSIMLPHSFVTETLACCGCPYFNPRSLCLRMWHQTSSITSFIVHTLDARTHTRLLEPAFWTLPLHFGLYAVASVYLYFGPRCSGSVCALSFSIFSTPRWYSCTCASRLPCYAQLWLLHLCTSRVQADARRMSHNISRLFTAQHVSYRCLYMNLDATVALLSLHILFSFIHHRRVWVDYCTFS